MKWPKGWGDKTLLMGIVNITPDSFSDGGLCLDPNDALLKATELIRNGAHVIDLGAQSTRPGAKEVGANEEIRRLMPALKLIRFNYPDLIISVDTFLSSVAKVALDLGANWINDVTGGRRDPEMLSIVSKAKCPYIIMHSRGDSNSMDRLIDYQNVVHDVYNELELLTRAAIKKGVSPTNIIWDPGIGFAKTTEQNLLLIRKLEVFTSSKYPVLIGPSRKRFIGDILNEPDPKCRLVGTLAVASRCFQAKASLLRVHDVEAMSKFSSMLEAIS